MRRLLESAAEAARSRRTSNKDARGIDKSVMPTLGTCGGSDCTST